jgi:hypothetical protein
VNDPTQISIEPSSKFFFPEDLNKAACLDPPPPSLLRKLQKKKRRKRGEQKKESRVWMIIYFISSYSFKLEIKCYYSLI